MGVPKILHLLRDPRQIRLEAAGIGAVVALGGRITLAFKKRVQKK